MNVTELGIKNLLEIGLDPSVAMRQFRNWVIKISGAKSKPIFVGLNAGFDWSFINYYFYNAKIENPFGFSSLDIKSMYFAATNKKWSQSISSVMVNDVRPKSNANHGALTDAIVQAELFRLIILKYKTN